MDFTFKKINELYNILQKKDYAFTTVTNYLSARQVNGKTVILRHDVEKKYENALKFAQIQNELGISGTYYFRFLEKSFNLDIVKKIADLGHEIGYHYDDLTVCRGDYDAAFKRFKKNLRILSAVTDIKTICMDGSPMSKYDNRDLWKKFSYKDLGIDSEPYFDVNFNDIFYLTDTGRRWDGWKTSVRDKMPQQEKWIKEGLLFHSTDDIINAANENRLPNKIMFTFHPQRWNSKPLPWVKELMLQNMKNVVKKHLIKLNAQKLK